MILSTSKKYSLNDIKILANSFSKNEKFSNIKYEIIAKTITKLQITVKSNNDTFYFLFNPNLYYVVTNELSPYNLYYYRGVSIYNHGENIKLWQASRANPKHLPLITGHISSCCPILFVDKLFATDYT